MRDESTVLKQVLNFAENDERIRAVIMNGSRVNPNAPKDLFQDYDVIMVTTDVDYYKENKEWINQFGELVMYQHNLFANGHIYLMLFKDIVRIDMSFFPVDKITELEEDSLSLILLDKDNVLPPLEAPSEKSYYVKKPSKNEFAEAINEFYWCLNNVAKGIYREELVYVKWMFENIVREVMIKMLNWYIGINNNFMINPGKAGKWFKKYLPKDLYDLLNLTYSGNDYQKIWDSIFDSCKLMRKVGMYVAEKLSYEYPLDDDQNMVEYLEKVRLMQK